MAVIVSPFGPKPFFVLATGLPAVGNQLFFYVGGSVNTKQNTYTDSTGGTPNANPMILNSLGEPTTEIWFTAGLSYKVVYAPSTDTDPPTSPIWSIDHLTGVSDNTGTPDQWIAYGGTPTYVGATQFTLTGDQTQIFHVGRRVKTTNSGGTIYSTITNTVFAAVTTVTVVNDSGVLDSGLSAVSYGLISFVYTSVNAAMLERKTWEVPGTIGSTTPNTGAFTTVNSNAGITTTDLAVPPTNGIIVIGTGRVLTMLTTGISVTGGVTITTDLAVPSTNGIIVGATRMLALTATDLTFAGRANLKSYTVGTLPAAGAAAGIIYVSDAGGNGPCIALSNGANWKRCDNTSTTVT